MSRWIEPTEEMEKGWAKWVAERPEKVRAVAEKFFPWELYKMKSTGHRVTLVSLSEDTDGNVTVTVNITGQFNKIDFDRKVVGIDPEDLAPCELPELDEELGTEMSPQQVEENIDEIRMKTRPDLWTRGPDGKAVRRQ